MYRPGGALPPDFSLLGAATRTIVRDNRVVERLLVRRVQAGVFEKWVIAAKIRIENYPEGVDWGDIWVQVLRSAARQIVSVENFHPVSGCGDHAAMITLHDDDRRCGGCGDDMLYQCDDTLVDVSHLIPVGGDIFSIIVDVLAVWAKNIWRVGDDHMGENEFWPWRGR